MEDMRSYTDTKTTVINGFAYYEWEFMFVLSQEEIQYIYYSLTFDEATTGDASYPSYYEIYLDGIKYLQVYPAYITGFGKDTFINLLNSVRVLSQKVMTIKFFYYVRANFAPCNGIMSCTVKTIK